jgi:hypothetical protein
MRCVVCGFASNASCNELLPNHSGTNHRDPSKKKRKTTQINVIESTEEAAKRFKDAFTPTDGYDYLVTTDTKELVARLKATEDWEKEEETD